jgi:sortase A
MGYIEIPGISVYLPIYHGTDDAVLQVGAGHIEGSSFPVGGESTHSVLSGHRGLKSAKLFTDIDQLTEGDVFMLHVLNETLTYQVDQIRIVLPEELDDLKIETGEDYCTLITCTPYGVNTHRLLVRGHRIENTETTGVITSEAVQVNKVIVYIAFGTIILLIYILFYKIVNKTILMNFR